jgi:hypothetical protein
LEEVESNSVIILKDLIPEDSYLCNAFNKEQRIDEFCSVHDLLLDASKIGYTEISLFSLRKPPKEKEEEEDEAEGSEPAVFNGRKIPDVLEKKAEKIRAATEYQDGTGLFVDTPICEAHDTKFPGMAILQIGNSTNNKKNTAPTAAICLVQHRYKSSGKYHVKPCSNRIFVGLKAIKQHTSVHGHVESLKRQGAYDGKHYVLECTLCPPTTANGHHKAQAAYPWVHEHYKNVGDTTTTRLVIDSPYCEEAIPFLPVVDCSTKARIVPWLQTHCGYHEDRFPSSSVFPDHVMRLHYLLCEDTRAVVFAFNCKLPKEFDEDMRHRFLSPYKFSTAEVTSPQRSSEDEDLMEIDEDDDDEEEEENQHMWRLMCVPCNDKTTFVEFAERMEKCDMSQRIQLALVKLKEFDPFRNIGNAEMFQNVLKLGDPILEFSIPDPNQKRVRPPKEEPIQRSPLKRKKRKKKQKKVDIVEQTDTFQRKYEIAVETGFHINFRHLLLRFPKYLCANKLLLKEWPKENGPEYVSLCKTLESAPYFNLSCTQNAIRFVKNWLQPIIRQHFDNDHCIELIEKTFVWCVAQLGFFYKTNTIEELFDPEELDINHMLYSILEGWACLIMVQMTTINVKGNYHESKKEQKRMSNKVVMSDHPERFGSIKSHWDQYNQKVEDSEKSESNEEETRNERLIAASLNWQIPSEDDSEKNDQTDPLWDNILRKSQEKLKIREEYEKRNREALLREEEETRKKLLLKQEEIEKEKLAQKRKREEKLAERQAQREAAKLARSSEQVEPAFEFMDYEEEEFSEVDIDQIKIVLQTTQLKE